MSLWTKEEVCKSIKRLNSEGVYLNGNIIREEFPALYDAGRILFGSWKKALKKNGINLSKTQSWTRSNIILEINKIYELGKDISSNSVSRYTNGLYSAARKQFGSWKQALESAGVIYENISDIQIWNKEKVKEIIFSLNKYGEPLNYKFVFYKHVRLLKAAEKYFGSWKAALEECGFDYEDIRKDRNNSQFIGKDSIKYESNLKMLIADELFELKNSKKINGYDNNVRLTHNRWWSCDFLIYLNNNSEMWIEVDNIGSSRSPPYGEKHPKIKYFNEAGLVLKIITSTNQLPNIILSESKFYQIPKIPSIITAHANPDADAISSCVAVYSHLLDNGIESIIKLEGDIPNNLQDMLPENKLEIEAKQVIVLDSGWETERLGWKIPELPIINIDHHMSRKDLHDPENKIFVIDMCSTAAILIRLFGLKNNILLAGIYGDTLFRRRISEVAQLLVSLDIDDDESQNIINNIDQVNSKMVLSAIKKASVTKHRNGFLFVELIDSVPSWVLTDIISIMSRLGDSICLVSESGEVRLRTLDKDIDVSKIAAQFDGGGHRFAAGCIVNKRSKLKRVIRTYKKEKNET